MGGGGGGVEQNWKYSSAQLGLELGNTMKFIDIGKSLKDHNFPKCHIRGGVVKKILEFFQFLGHIFAYTPFLHTETFNLGTE